MYTNLLIAALAIIAIIVLWHGMRKEANPPVEAQLQEIGQNP